MLPVEILLYIQSYCEPEISLTLACASRIFKKPIIDEYILHQYCIMKSKKELSKSFLDICKYGPLSSLIIIHNIMKYKLTEVTLNKLVVDGIEIAVRHKNIRLFGYIKQLNPYRFTIEICRCDMLDMLPNELNVEELRIATICGSERIKLYAYNSYMNMWNKPVSIESRNGELHSNSYDSERDLICEIGDPNYITRYIGYLKPEIDHKNISILCKQGHIDLLEKVLALLDNGRYYMNKKLTPDMFDMLYKSCKDKNRARKLFKYFNNYGVIHESRWILN